VRIGWRKGDGAETCMIELVGSELVKRAEERAKRREERLKQQQEGADGDAPDSGKDTSKE
jgi:large subunit ribosomal protein L17